jgi:FkbM family methyltransferase
MKFLYYLFFKLFKKFLLFFYFKFRNILYWLYKLFSISFSYTLINKSKIKLYPKGQITKAVFFREFEIKELEVLQLFLEPGFIMIDSGANIGLYTIIGSILVGNKGKIYSFEPSYLNYKLFTNNIFLNKLNNVKSFNVGLSDKIGEKLVLGHDIFDMDAEKYVINNDNYSSTSDFLNLNNPREYFFTNTIDNIVIEENINKVNILKIDVEGFEYFILKGAYNTLLNNNNIVILIECADHLAMRAGSSQSQVLDYLQKLNFEIVWWNNDDKVWVVYKNGVINCGQFYVGKNIYNRILNKYLN